MREATHGFEFRLPARPTQVIFDPGDVLLKSIKIEKSRARSGAASSRRPSWASIGVLAARALGRAPRPGQLEALIAALGDDRFWAVRAPPRARSARPAATRRATR